MEVAIPIFWIVFCGFPGEILVFWVKDDTAPWALPVTLGNRSDFRGPKQGRDDGWCPTFYIFLFGSNVKIKIKMLLKSKMAKFDFCPSFLPAFKNKFKHQIISKSLFLCFAAGALPWCVLRALLTVLTPCWCGPRRRAEYDQTTARTDVF